MALSGHKSRSSKRRVCSCIVISQCTLCQIASRQTHVVDGLKLSESLGQGPVHAVRRRNTAVGLWKSVRAYKGKEVRHKPGLSYEDVEQRLMNLDKLGQRNVRIMSLRVNMIVW